MTAQSSTRDDLVAPSPSRPLLLDGYAARSCPVKTHNAFDPTVTISFGIRNVEDPSAALRELRRVTRPGGTLVVCEFSTPTWAPFRVAYLNYLVAALPRIARLISSNPVAYEYLAESIQAWPDQPGLAAVIGEAGWRDVEWRNLSGGIVALHRARN